MATVPNSDSSEQPDFDYVAAESERRAEHQRRVDAERRGEEPIKRLSGREREVERLKERWSKENTFEEMEIAEDAIHAARAERTNKVPTPLPLLTELARIIRETPARGVLVDEIGAKVLAALV